MLFAPQAMHDRKCNVNYEVTQLPMYVCMYEIRLGTRGFGSCKNVEKLTILHNIQQGDYITKGWECIVR